jgi:hypothetical protein
MLCVTALHVCAYAVHTACITASKGYILTLLFMHIIYLLKIIIILVTLLSCISHCYTHYYCCYTNVNIIRLAVVTMLRWCTMVLSMVTCSWLLRHMTYWRLLQTCLMMNWLPPSSSGTGVYTNISSTYCTWHLQQQEQSSPYYCFGLFGMLVVQRLFIVWICNWRLKTAVVCVYYANDVELMFIIRISNQVFSTVHRFKTV